MKTAMAFVAAAVLGTIAASAHAYDPDWKRGAKYGEAPASCS